MRPTLTLFTGLSAVLVGVGASLLLPATPAVPAAAAHAIPTVNPMLTSFRAELASSDTDAAVITAGLDCSEAAVGTVETASNLTFVCEADARGRHWRVVEG